MADITIVNGVYKPTYNWGAPPCMIISIVDGVYKPVYPSYKWNIQWLQNPGG